MLVSRLQRSQKQRGRWGRKLSRLLLLGLLGLVLVSTTASMYAASVQAPLATSGNASPKDETVFVNLGNDGAVREVYVVNTFHALTGALLDFGAYSSVQNLSDEREISLSDGRVERVGGTQEEQVFRYQGTLEQVALPWLFNVGYQLNGKTLTAEQLLGASGRLRISISVRPNPAAPSHFADRYTVQAVVPLLVDKAADVYASGATSLLVGNRLTLGFVVQPGESHLQTIEATVRDFALPRMEITAFRAAKVQGAWRDTLESALSGLTGGLTEMVGGTTTLRNGLSTLHTGVGELRSSLIPLTNGALEFEAALNEYAQGVEEFAAGLADLHAADLEVQKAGQLMLGHITAVQSGYNDLSTGLSELRAQGSGARELANALLASPDPAVSQLAHAALLQLAALERLEQGLTRANAGLAEFASGQTTLAQQKEALSQGLAQAAGSSAALAEGGSEIAASGSVFLGGVAALPAGIRTLYANTRRLPGDVDKLIAGQRLMLSGVRDSRRDLGRLLGEGRDRSVISFADPLRGNARSVQFVFVTSPIEAEHYTVTLPELPVPTTLTERIVELVRRILLLGRESTR
ncbi:MAG: hypothetical protein DDT38_01165 [Firmicutes bacterium]|nr:hypothetical protein [candidate division NPL-UPA2 bacterium]